MKCPSCQERLGIFRIDDLKVHECLHCERLWAPLDVIAALASNDPDSTSVDSLVAITREHGVQSAFYCPDCLTVPLRVVNFDCLEIEACSVCHGVLFDNGEVSEMYPEGLHQQEEKMFPFIGGSVSLENIGFSLNLGINLPAIIKRIKGG